MEVESDAGLLKKKTTARARGVTKADKAQSKARPLAGRMEAESERQISLTWSSEGSEGTKFVCSCAEVSQGVHQSQPATDETSRVSICRVYGDRLGLLFRREKKEGRALRGCGSPCCFLSSDEPNGAFPSKHQQPLDDPASSRRPIGPHLLRMSLC